MSASAFLLTCVILVPCCGLFHVFVDRLTTKTALGYMSPYDAAPDLNGSEYGSVSIMRSSLRRIDEKTSTKSLFRNLGEICGSYAFTR